MAAAGALIGVLAAAAAYRVIQSLFVGVRADAQSTVAAVGVLTFAMLVSTFIPARRAARLNPTDALRSD
jgi:ABC-type lipoprotein release transport system permease subunit